MPSASHKLPACTGQPRGRHQWRTSFLSLQSRGTVETCHLCGMRRIVIQSGRVIRDA